jgi:hypothetical protein
LVTTFNIIVTPRFASQAKTITTHAQVNEVLDDQAKINRLEVNLLSPPFHPHPYFPTSPSSTYLKFASGPVVLIDASVSDESGTGFRYFFFAESGSESRLLLKTDPNRIRTQNKIFMTKLKNKNTFGNFFYHNLSLYVF